MEQRQLLSLQQLPDDELLLRLDALVSESHRIEAELVAHIGEVDARRLYARFAFPSMFAYCTEKLHLSEAAAYRRITVARAARKCPETLSALRDGRIHLSGLATLVPLLTPANCSELLAKATHRTKRQIEELVATLAPRPDARAGIRRLSERSLENRTDRSVNEGGLDRTGGGRRRTDSVSRGVLDDGTPRDELVPGRVHQPTLNDTLTVPATGASVLAARPLGNGPVVEALSPGRYKVQFTATAELRDKLERLRALMRAEVPDGDLAAIIERAVSEKLERLEARRFAKTAAPRKSLPQTDTTHASRYLPAAVRRAVAERDGGRCRYVDERGRRCSERHRLEFHHFHPYAMGGDHRPDNIRLMCPAHNRHLAVRDYGSAAIRSRLESQRAVRLADPHG
jgi:hypothetical protein